MYLQYFGFVREPFGLVPDSSLFLESEVHGRALADLLDGIQRRRGFLLLTGGPGTGKTTICRALLGRFGNGELVAATLEGPALSHGSLVPAAAEAFDLEHAGDPRRELLAYLRELAARGVLALLIVDEAQTLPPPILEEIRQLGNLEADGRKLLQVLLVGSSELEALLATPPLEALSQRIATRCRLEPFSLDGTVRYIDHRVSLSRPRAVVRFDPDALRDLHDGARGNPRRLNVVADRALVRAWERKAATVTREDVQAALRDLALAPASASSEAPPASPAAAAPVTASPVPAATPAEPARRGIPWPVVAGTALAAIAFGWVAGSSFAGFGGVAQAEAPRAALPPSPRPVAALPSPTPSPTPAATATPAPSPTATASPTPSPSASPTASPSASPTASPSPSPSPSTSPTPSPTASPSPSASPTASTTPSATASRTPGPSPSASPRVTTAPAVSPATATPARATSTPTAPTGTPEARRSPTPQATPEPPAARGDWSWDASGTLRVARAESAYHAAVLTWLSLAEGLRVDERELSRLRAMDAGTLATMALTTGRPPLFLREARLPPSLPALRPTWLPVIVQTDREANGFGPWVVLTAVSASEVTVLDPLRGRLTLARTRFEDHLAGVMSLYRDSEGLTPLRPGDRGPAVAALRTRLHLMGFLQASPEAETYDADVARAVRLARERYGLPAGDAMDGALVVELLRAPAPEAMRTPRAGS